MTDRLRVVLATNAATGHVYPLLGLAEALRADGHAVTFVTTADLTAWLEGLGFATRTAGETIWTAVGAVQERDPDLTTHLPRDEAWRLDAELFAFELPRRNTIPLAEVIGDLHPDLVVFESANLGARLAASRLGIPAVCLDLWAAGRWHVPQSELEARLRAAWAEVSTDPLPVDPLYGVARLDPAPPSLTAPRPDSGGSTTRRIPMRQLAWGDPALPPVQLDRPGTRPLVYLTLGTVGWGSAELLREALAGISSQPVDVLVAVGAHFDPAELGALDDSVRVERFVRQDLLWPHVAAVVHHGGSGTLLGAATHAVPQLVLPSGADQFQNATVLAGSGAGRAVPPGEVTVASVSDGVADLLDDPSYRIAARQLQDEIAALPTPVEVLPDLLELARPSRSTC